MTVITLPGCKLPTEPPAELRCIEPSPAPEFFCSDLARLSVHGPFTRLTWSVPELPIECPKQDVQNLINLKVIIPTIALQAIYDAIGKMLADAAPAEGEAG